MKSGASTKAGPPLNLTIEPNLGLGCLRFGMLPEQVEERLGPPDITDEHAGPAPDFGFGWGYDRYDLDVFFHLPGLYAGKLDLKGPRQLLMFTCSSTALTLWGERIVGLREPQLRALVARHGEHPLSTVDDETCAPSQSILRADDLNLDFCFEGERLARCQWRWTQRM